MGLTKYSIDLFNDDMTNKDSLMYCLVALVVYTGDSVRGHYQCAVRVMADGVSSWLLCDDDQKPIIHQDIPHWMVCRTSHIWMIKNSDYQPWQWTVDQEHEASSCAMADVLALLRN